MEGVSGRVTSQMLRESEVRLLEEHIQPDDKECRARTTLTPDWHNHGLILRVFIPSKHMVVRLIPYGPWAYAPLEDLAKTLWVQVGEMMIDLKNYMVVSDVLES